MNYDTVHFGYELTNPDRLSVYDRATAIIDGVECELAVIGSSHCVRAPSVEFAEIASCDAATVGDGRTIELADCETMSLEHDTPSASCETTIRVQPIEQFAFDAAFDLRYAFAERAVTAIDVIDDGYETWHTYPEHGRAVYTETVFDRLGPTTRRSRDAPTR